MTAKKFNLNGKITSALRRIWRTYPLRSAAIALARDPNTPKHVICNACGSSVHEKLAAVDHIEPVVPVTGTNSWDVKIDRMFFPEGGVAGLQILCENCHAKKSLQERRDKSDYKKSLKPPKVPRERKRKAKE